MKDWFTRLSQRRNDRILGGSLAILGMFSAAGTAAYFFLSGASLPLSMLLVPAGFTLFGVLLVFSNELERGLQIEDEIDDFPALIQDDIEDLKQGKITPAHGMLLITLLTLIGLTLTIFLYRKWEATWGGGLNALGTAVVLGFITGFVGVTTRWFQHREKRYSWGIFLIPVTALAISAFLGMYYTEPKVISVRDQPANQSVGYESSSATSRLESVDGGGGFSIMDGAMDLDCDDEACLILILIVIAIACIVASAFIPHFWLVASSILWVIMLLLTLRELIYQPGKLESG